MDILSYIWMFILFKPVEEYIITFCVGAIFGVLITYFIVIKGENNGL